MATIFMLLPRVSKADEGMWMVQMFENSIYPQMKKKGLKLGAKEIYNEDVANALSSAIVSLDFGCTGSMISQKGLLITNHHCAYGDIFGLSTKEHNYLEEGFWAKTMAEEKPIKGKNALFLRKVIDVSLEVEEEINKLQKRNFKGMMLRRIYKIIEERYKKQNLGYEAICSSMWNGEQYYVFLYEVYSDVRLVGAPPVSIGAFGGEIDNWGWPQHKGDFAIYRVYANENGKPAAFSSKNVPLVPSRTLNISAKGLKPNDFTMIMGYPGRTNRYASSFEVKEKQEIINPIVVEARRSKLNVWLKHMEANPDLRLIYSDKYFGISNYTDFAKWENKCFRRYNVQKIRETEEQELRNWDCGTDKKAENNKLLDNMKIAYDASAELMKNKTWFRESYLSPCDWIGVIRKFASIARNMERDKIDSVSIKDKSVKAYIKMAKAGFKDFDAKTDLELFGEQANLFIQNLDESYLSDTLKTWIKRFNSNGAAMAEYIYNTSNYSTIEKIEKFFASPKSAKDIMNDPAFDYIEGCSIGNFNSKAAKLEKQCGSCPEKLKPIYTRAIYKMREAKNIAQYPNANSSMRITYGNVCDLKPSDGVYYSYRTSINGYREKEDETVYEFNVNNKMKKLIAAKDWGKWGENGELYVNFLTNNDITGGNSGSPVMNGKGELVGLAFDGNRESMSGDVYFHPQLFKTVCVDIRFVLWVIDKYAGANHLIDEMNISYK